MAIQSTLIYNILYVQVVAESNLNFHNNNFTIQLININYFHTEEPPHSAIKTTIEVGFNSSGINIQCVLW